MEGMQAEEGLQNFRILALGCFPKERLSLRFLIYVMEELC